MNPILSVEVAALFSTAKEAKKNTYIWFGCAVILMLAACTSFFWAITSFLWAIPLSVGFAISAGFTFRRYRRYSHKASRLPFIDQPDREKQYYALCLSLFRLAQANKIWLLKARHPADSQENWGLSEAIERQVVTIETDKPPHSPYSQETWSIKSEAVKIYALPHAFLVLLGSVYYLMPLNKCHVNFLVDVIPEESIPLVDAQSLGQVRQESRGIQRTAQLMKYAFVSLCLKDIRFTLIVSNVEIAKKFVVDFCTLTGATLDRLEDQVEMADIQARIKASKPNSDTIPGNEQQNRLPQDDLAIIQKAIAENQRLSTSQVAAICGRDRDEITQATRGRRNYIDYQGFRFARAGGRIGRELAWTITERSSRAA